MSLSTLFRVLSVSFLIAAISCAEQADSAAPAKGGGDGNLQGAPTKPASDGVLDLNVETLAEGLVNPWSIAFLPDGAILVTEREGRLRIIRDGELAATPISNVPDVYLGGQAGLFDVLPHPDFQTNNVVFLAYAQGVSNANGLRVVRATFDGSSLSDIKIIYDAKPLKNSSHHYGGRLVWGPDNKLYISVGEGSRYKEKAQDYGSSFGAIIRINEDGSIPDDNPDFDRAGALPELYTKGHRNPQGLAYDATRDVLWSNEHGPRGGDELNLIKPGGNYGWPLATYGMDYNGARITPFTEYEGTEQPFKYWTPSPAISGLAIYEGALFPESWRGDVLLGAMKLGALHRIDLEGDEEIAEERYLIGERVRDVRVGPDGAIYLTTEHKNGRPIGKLLRLTPQ